MADQYLPCVWYRLSVDRPFMFFTYPQRAPGGVTDHCPDLTSVDHHHRIHPEPIARLGSVLLYVCRLDLFCHDLQSDPSTQTRPVLSKEPADL